MHVKFELPKLLRSGTKVCGGGARNYMVLKVSLVISLSLSQAEQYIDTQTKRNILHHPGIDSRILFKVLLKEPGVPTIVFYRIFLIKFLIIKLQYATFS